MYEQIQELYNYSLEKYAGDEEAATQFVVGFMKEASMSRGAAELGWHTINEAALKGLGGAAVGIGVGLGIHGVSSMMNGVGTSGLHGKFKEAYSKAIAMNPVVAEGHRTEPARVDSYAETIFKFAPHVACDANLLSTVLANAVHGENVDPTIIKSIVDLESKLIETRKNSLFSPKTYL
jgi:hypothetical protein